MLAKAYIALLTLISQATPFGHPLTPSKRRIVLAALYSSHMANITTVTMTNPAMESPRHICVHFPRCRCGIVKIGITFCLSGSHSFCDLRMNPMNSRVTRINPTYIKYECHCLGSKLGSTKSIMPMMDWTLFDIPEHVMTHQPTTLSTPTEKAANRRFFSGARIYVK